MPWSFAVGLTYRLAFDLSRTELDAGAQAGHQANSRGYPHGAEPLGASRRTVQNPLVREAGAINEHVEAESSPHPMCSTFGFTGQV